MKREWPSSGRQRYVRRKITSTRCRPGWIRAYWSTRRSKQRSVTTRLRVKLPTKITMDNWTRKRPEKGISVNATGSVSRGGCGCCLNDVLQVSYQAARAAVNWWKRNDELKFIATEEETGLLLKDAKDEQVCSSSRPAGS